MAHPDTEQAVALDQMPTGELVKGLMRGNKDEFKLGYSAENAARAVKDLRPNEDFMALINFASGFADGMREDRERINPA